MDFAPRIENDYLVQPQQMMQHNRAKSSMGSFKTLGSPVKNGVNYNDNDKLVMKKNTRKNV